MTITRRQALAGLSALAAPEFLLASATYPTKPVEIVVPATPGGATDIGARAAGLLLQEALGQPFVVQNKAGASGTIAAAYVARAEKTGHVIGIATDSSVIISPLVMQDLAYKPEDFQLLSPLYMGGFALAVGKDFPANNLKEFIEETRKRGELAATMIGASGSPRLVAEMFMADAGVKLVPVPYKGESEAVRDVMAGLAPSFFGSTASLLPQRKAGTIKILAVSSTERMPVLADVPTFAESGFPNTVYRWFHGMKVPAGTPKAVVDELGGALYKAVGSERFRAAIAPDMTPTPMRPEAFTQMVAATREKVRAIIKAKNIKA